MQENPKIGEVWDPAPLGWGVGDPVEIAPLPTCVTMPSLVGVGQTIRGALLTRFGVAL